MPVNVSKGSMYPDVDGTINFIRGACEASCVYCFMKYGFRANLKAYKEPYKLVEKEFETFDAEPGSRIFCGSATDMWRAPVDCIRKVLEFCLKQEEENEIEWLFQTKYPNSVSRWIQHLPRNSMIGVTLETNRSYDKRISRAPSPTSRAYAMKSLLDLWTKHYLHHGLSISYSPRIMVSIEPIMEFDLEPFVDMIRSLETEYVSIGVDTQGAFLEHDIELVKMPNLTTLAERLGEFTQVKIKPNVLRVAETMNLKKALAKILNDLPGVTFLERRKADRG